MTALEPPDDASLVRRALAGDRWAEEALYRRHVHRVTTAVAKLLRHEADVEDVVQDAFVDAFVELPRLRDPERVGRWIVRIAVHKVHKRFRRRRLLRLLGLDRSHADLDWATQLVDGTAQETRVALLRVEAVLAREPDEVRAAWVLRHLEGYALDEIVELTGASLATVKRRIARAERALLPDREADR